MATTPFPKMRDKRPEALRLLRRVASVAKRRRSADGRAAAVLTEFDDLVVEGLDMDIRPADLGRAAGVNPVSILDARKRHAKRAGRG
jgi:hypothetical protein